MEKLVGGVGHWEWKGVPGGDVRGEAALGRGDGVGEFLLALLAKPGCLRD
jgi:hypothetical protein